MRSTSPVLVLITALASRAAAHGDHGGSHGQKPMVDEHADWMTKHMAGTDDGARIGGSWNCER